MSKKRPRHYADELLQVMREWLAENVPSEERQATAMHVRAELFKRLPASKPMIWGEREAMKAGAESERV